MLVWLGPGLGGTGATNLEELAASCVANAQNRSLSYGFAPLCLQYAHPLSGQQIQYAQISLSMGEYMHAARNSDNS